MDFEERIVERADGITTYRFRMAPIYNHSEIVRRGSVIEDSTRFEDVTSESIAMRILRHTMGSSSPASVGRPPSSEMTDEMYEVYKKHGGRKKHPLDEVQGL